MKAHSAGNFLKDSMHAESGAEASVGPVQEGTETTSKGTAYQRPEGQIPQTDRVLQEEGEGRLPEVLETAITHSYGLPNLLPIAVFSDPSQAESTLPASDWEIAREISQRSRR